VRQASAALLLIGRNVVRERQAGLGPQMGNRGEARGFDLAREVEAAQDSTLVPSIADSGD
jgi:hypothetical protein